MDSLSKHSAFSCYDFVYMKEILLTKTLLTSLVKNTNVFLMFLFHLFIQNLFNTALEFQISVYNV